MAGNLGSFNYEIDLETEKLDRKLKQNEKKFDSLAGEIKKNYSQIENMMNADVTKNAKAIDKKFAQISQMEKKREALLDKMDNIEFQKYQNGIRNLSKEDKMRDSMAIKESSRMQKNIEKSERLSEKKLQAESRALAKIEREKSLAMARNEKAKQREIEKLKRDSEKKAQLEIKSMERVEKAKVLARAREDRAREKQSIKNKRMADKESGRNKFSRFSTFKTGTESVITGLTGNKLAGGVAGLMIAGAIGSAIKVGFRETRARMEEARNARTGIIEARAVSGTFLRNMAIQEGRDPNAVLKEAQKNARAYAKNTIFNERQTLIAQGALAEGGAGTKRSISPKYINSLLDATIARYNKSDVSEAQIQKMAQMVSRVAQTGKFGLLKAQFLPAGERWINKVEKSSVEQRYEMLFDYMQKSMGGLAQRIKTEDMTNYLAIEQRNRTQALLTGEIGKLGTEFDTLSQSLKNNLNPLMTSFAKEINLAMQYINKATMSKDDKFETNYNRLKGLMSKEQVAQIEGARTTYERQKYIQEATKSVIIKGVSQGAEPTGNLIESARSFDTMTVAEKQKYIEDLQSQKEIANNIAMYSKDNNMGKLTKDEQAVMDAEAQRFNLLNQLEFSSKKAMEGSGPKREEYSGSMRLYNASDRDYSADMKNVLEQLNTTVKNLTPVLTKLSNQ